MCRTLQNQCRGLPGSGRGRCTVSHPRGELGYCDCHFPSASPMGEENNVQGAHVQGEEGGPWWSDLGGVRHLQKVSLDPLPLHSGGPVSCGWCSSSLSPSPVLVPQPVFLLDLPLSSARALPCCTLFDTRRKGRVRQCTRLSPSPSCGSTKRWSAGLRGPPRPRELRSEGWRDLRLRVGKGTPQQAPGEGRAQRRVGAKRNTGPRQLPPVLERLQREGRILPFPSSCVFLG